MSNQTCDDKFLETLERINPKLKFYCQHLAWCSGIIESDDCYQQSLLKMLERSRTDPEFLNQNDSYVICYGIWMAKNFVNHERNLYHKKIVDQDSLDHGEPEFHYRVNRTPNPEAETAKLEVRRLAENMSDGYQYLFKKIVEGYSVAEISQQMQISKWTYFSKKGKMIRVINTAWSAPMSRKNSIMKELGQGRLVQR